MCWVFGHSVIMLDVLAFIQQFIITQFANFCSLCLGLRTLGNLTRPLKGTRQFQKAPHLEVLLFLFFLSHKKNSVKTYELQYKFKFLSALKKFFVCPPFATRASSIGLTEPRAIYSFSLEIENENTFIYNFFSFFYITSSTIHQNGPGQKYKNQSLCLK